MSEQLIDIIHSYREAKEKYRFFDMNTWSLSTDRELLKPIAGMDELIRELGAHHILEAIVTNVQSIEYNPIIGNENLLAQIKNHGHLYGSIVWTPEIVEVKTGIVKYLERMIASKIAAVRMFPKKLNHSMKRWQIGDVLHVMESMRLPLILWHSETNWDTVQSICEEYPQLPVIVEGNDQKLLYHNRFFIPLLGQHENLYIETHNLIQHGGIEHIVNERGIDRLIFGTYFPYNDPNAAMMMLTHADIPEKTKYKIAGDHLRGLIHQISLP